MLILFKAILGFLKLKFCQQLNPQPISAILNNLQNHNWKNASDSLWIWKGRRGSLSKNNRCQRYTALDFGVVICACVSTEGRVSQMVHWHPPAKPKDSQGLLPLPNIEDCLSTLSGSIYFSTLEMESGYYQVEIDPAARKKTAFITRFGLFEHVCMGFCLCNVPALFLRVIQLVLRGLTWKDVYASGWC